MCVALFQAPLGVMVLGENQGRESLGTWLQLPCTWRNGAWGEPGERAWERGYNYHVHGWLTSLSAQLNMIIPSIVYLLRVYLIRKLEKWDNRKKLAIGDSS